MRADVIRACAATCNFLYLVMRDVTVEVVLGCKSRCKSQFCKDCALAHCVSWREKLRPALAHWKSVMMLTLTLDRSRHESPEAGYRYVGKKRSVSELIKKLHKRKMIRSREFTTTLEFHKVEKSGWPHYHVLVDSSFVDKHELQRLWGLGNCWYSKHEFKSISHAINYATKYISKTSEDDDEEFWFPEWVLDFKGNMRRFSTSRGLCPSGRKRKKKADGEKTRPRIRKTGRQRSEI